MPNIIVSSRPDISGQLEREQHSFYELYAKACARHGDRTAFVCAATGRKVTFAQSLATTKRVAGYLYHRHGIRAGDVVALMAPNIPEYVSLFQGITSLGAIVTPLNSMYSAFEVDKQLVLSGAKLILAVSHFAAPVDEGVKSAASKGHVVEILVVDKSELLNPTVAVEPVPESYNHTPKPGDVVALPFSSGTTGLPKGVQLTNRNLVANVLQMHDVVDVVPEDITIAVLPYFHIYGLVAILHLFIHAGGTQIVMAKFDIDVYLSSIEKNRPTYLFVAPPILLGLIKHPKTPTTDATSVKRIISGAAPLGEELQKLAEPLFPNALIVQGYGLTETSPVISVCPFDRKRYGAAGTLVGNTEIRVVKVGDDDSTSDVAPGEGEGELWVRGPQVMKGYLRDEDNKVVFPEPGWFRTGDLVKVDHEGLIVVTDRIKELIKYKGYQVAPAELEALIQTHPFVQETIVVGVADKEEGAGNEVPRAHVVLKPSITEEQRQSASSVIQAFVDNTVAPYKKLRGGLRIVDSIPKSPAGKLLRRLVREQENAWKEGK